MAFEQSPEGGEGVGQVDNRRRTFQGVVSTGYMVNAWGFIRILVFNISEMGKH